MKGFVRKLLSRPQHLSFPHVAQWLVSATDDRVVAGSNPSECQCRAASKLGALGEFVYHTSHTSGPKYCVFRHNKLLVTSIWCL